jgi:restriction endonuclease S subunit
MTWNKVRLGDLITESKVLSENPDPNKRITVRLKVLGIEKRGLENEIAGATKQYIRKAGQFIYGKQNFHKGAFGIIPKELDGYETSSDLPAFDVNKMCAPEWIFYFFKKGGFYLELASMARGVATQRIHPEQIFDLKVPLPSLEIQHKIIAKLESIEAKSTLLSNELSFQQIKLDQLVQAILQDAVQGKLVNQDPKEEPAAELLKRIKFEKAKTGKKEKPFQSIRPDEIPFEIPNNWVWCRLGEMCSKITDGFHNTPPKVKEGFPYIAATQVKSDKIDWDSCHYVSEKFHRELYLKTTPKRGEILVVNIGAGCGTPAIIDVDFEFSFKNTAILKFDQNEIYNKYIFYYFLLKRDEFYRDLTKGGLQPFLSLKILNDIIFPLPPLGEQKRIVGEVEKQLSKTKQLKKHILANQQTTEQLLKTILHQSFELEDN